MANSLQHESSPYLLQHADNPVNWFPWGEEAFRRAVSEDKPVFLSIGYSTCHWCHVMAHESFEDESIAELLNEHFIAIKVDKEERPDLDSIYMAVCQSFTGSGGWPTSIFLTPDQKPFFAGTYFPKRARHGMIGFGELLRLIHEEWQQNRQALLEQAEDILDRLRQQGGSASPVTGAKLIDAAVRLYKHSYDRKNGGFGQAPKFPAPHNLLFLMSFYERRGDRACLEMAEHSLRQMYRGGLFDHIGYGFCRYSTDSRFLVPHFEKMLYDNALLILAYAKAYALTGKKLYLAVAEKTAAYVLREMTVPGGGFASAQDADSDGEEGKYYLFHPEELTEVLGETDGEAFCRHFDITPSGNFEGKSIPNRLAGDPEDHSCDCYLDKVYSYRRERFRLHLDDKILTVWNSLMIAALCRLYALTGKESYRGAAEKAERFLREKLSDGDTLFVSFREGRRGVRGFLDDYAAVIFSQLSLYAVTLKQEYTERAKRLTEVVFRRFADREKGGFFLSGEENEALIFRPKESYDGAIPSGNSLMAWNLVRISQLSEEEKWEREAQKQLRFLSAEAAQYPTGYAMFLLALLDSELPPPRVTVVPAPGEDLETLPLTLPTEAVLRLCNPSEEYSLKDGKTSYYICRSHSCLPPVNDWREILPS